MPRPIRVLSWICMTAWMPLVAAGVFTLPDAWFTPAPAPVPHWSVHEVLGLSDGRVIVHTDPDSILLYGADGALQAKLPHPHSAMRGHALALGSDDTLYLWDSGGKGHIYAQPIDGGWRDIAQGGTYGEMGWKLGDAGIPERTKLPGAPPVPTAVAPGAPLFYRDAPAQSEFRFADGSSLRDDGYEIQRLDAGGAVTHRYGPPTWVRPFAWFHLPPLWVLMMIVLTIDRRQQRTERAREAARAAREAARAARAGSAT